MAGVIRNASQLMAWRRRKRPLKSRKHTGGKQSRGGVVSFYTFFTTIPRGKYIIRVCLGTACYVKGSKQILDNLQRELNVEIGGITQDRKFSLEAVRCLGACGLAPVLVVGQDTYGMVNPGKAIEIVKSYP
jgi:NADH-quinone oxidoreductase subunit E/NADP-reducing hydrogenase subunit HndA